MKHLKSYNESFVSDVLPMAASMLSILALVAIPFIPAALDDFKKDKEAKIRREALKDSMLRTILEKVGRNYQAQVLLESYNLGEISIEDFSTEMRRILKLILTRTQYEYCDEAIDKLK
jgi:hypothetical protein